MNLLPIILALWVALAFRVYGWPAIRRSFVYYRYRRTRQRLQAKGQEIQQAVKRHDKQEWQRLQRLGVPGHGVPGDGGPGEKLLWFHQPIAGRDLRERHKAAPFN